jgi:hypothetical protein
MGMMPGGVMGVAKGILAIFKFCNFSFFDFFFSLEIVS